MCEFSCQETVEPSEPIPCPSNVNDEFQFCCGWSSRLRLKFPQTVKCPVKVGPVRGTQAVASPVSGSRAVMVTGVRALNVPVWVNVDQSPFLFSTSCCVALNCAASRATCGSGTVAVAHARLRDQVARPIGFSLRRSCYVTLELAGFLREEDGAVDNVLRPLMTNLATALRPASPTSASRPRRSRARAAAATRTPDSAG